MGEKLIGDGFAARAQYVDGAGVTGTAYTIPYLVWSVRRNSGLARKPLFSQRQAEDGFRLGG
jgi:hypothetical protein